MATDLSLPTKNGDAIQLKQIDDDVLVLPFFPNIEEKLQAIKDLEYQEGDVMVCSYPKSGTHWIGNLVHKMLLRKVEDSQKERFIEQRLGLLELMPLEPVKNAMSPRLLFSHLRPQRLPGYFCEGKGKIVLVVRNPKDVAVSFFHHLRNVEQINNKQDWGEYFNSFTTGVLPYRSVVDYMKSWEQEIKANSSFDVEYFYFEDLKTNGIECLRRLAKHLNVDLDDTALQEIMDECSLNKLKEEEGKKHASDSDKLRTGKDGKSIIFRKGEIGDWKNHFTVAQNEMYTGMLETAMKDCMFKFRYE